MADRCPCEDGHPERCTDVGAGAEPLDPAVASIRNDLEVYAIPGENHIIDTINPLTGLSRCLAHTEAQVVERYPGAKRYGWADWQTEASARQRSPITWHPTTRENYRQMHEVLPPALYFGGAFLVGEPMDHDIWSGSPRYQGFWFHNGVYLAASRPLTCAELRAELKARIIAAWTPQYSRWRHGGWYVDNVRYPSGAVGCVSRNYADRKWRIACDDRPDAHELYTYPSRDDAARAEYAIADGMKPLK